MSHAGPLWSIERAAGTHPHNGLEASGNIRRALRIGRNLGLSASLPHPCTGAWPAEKALRPTRGQQRKPCGPRAAEKALRPTGSRESPAAHAWAAGQVLQPTHPRRVASGQSVLRSGVPAAHAAWVPESPQPTPRGFRGPRNPRSPQRVGSEPSSEPTRFWSFIFAGFAGRQSEALSVLRVSVLEYARPLRTSCVFARATAHEWERKCECECAAGCRVDVCAHTRARNRIPPPPPSAPRRTLTRSALPPPGRP